VLSGASGWHHSPEKEVIVTVVASVVSKAAPGRLEELLEMTRQGAKIMERHGASDLRLLNGSWTVEALGMLILSAEFPTGEAWGRYADSAATDEELQTSPGGH
jgi:hypothetical protein